ncbi:hypothetical protein NQZ68_025463 [Dissostichus eleginoides]|nr:hypothetical protein NQZ68_025463 [Dissostichus eleginoides]
MKVTAQLGSATFRLADGSRWHRPPSWTQGPGRTGTLLSLMSSCRVQPGSHLSRLSQWFVLKLVRPVSGLPPPLPPSHLPSPGPCTCANGSTLLKNVVPKNQAVELIKRREKEFQQHKAR